MSGTRPEAEGGSTSRLALLPLALDGGAAILALYAASALRAALPFGKPIPVETVALPVTVYWLAVGVVALTHVAMNVYAGRGSVPLRRELRAVLGAGVVVAIVFTSALYLSYPDLSRLQMLYFGGLYAAFVVVWRVAAHWLVRSPSRPSRPAAPPGVRFQVNLGLLAGGMAALLLGLTLVRPLVDPPAQEPPAVAGPVPSPPPTPTPPPTTTLPPTPTPGLPPTPTLAGPGVLEAEVSVVAEPENLPVALAFAPDGRLFFTEKPGALRVIVGGRLQPDPVVELPVADDNEHGLMGVALDPDFAANHFIWLTYQTRPDGEDGPLFSHVARVVESDGHASDLVIALTAPVLTNSMSHVMNNLHFGPDGLLYVVNGDHQFAANAQDMTLIAGKMHRFVPGVPLSIPGDNPFPGSSIYALGLRNTFDFTFDPLSDAIFATENGPNCDDEINRIEPGGNYGWGGENFDRCAFSLTSPDYPYVRPLTVFNPTEAPTGIVVYDHPRFEELRGKLLVCSWNSGKMRLVTLDEARRAIVAIAALDLGGSDCRTDVGVGPQGRVYFTGVNHVSRIDALSGP